MPSRSPTVVLAEDDAGFRQLLADELRSHGYDVVPIANGAELVDYLGKCAIRPERFKPPALIVTDVRMPGINGLDVLRGLSRIGHRTPVVVITAFGSSETHELAHALGASLVLDKPFDVEELVLAAQRLAPPRTDSGAPVPTH